MILGVSPARGQGWLKINDIQDVKSAVLLADARPLLPPADNLWEEQHIIIYFESFLILYVKKNSNGLHLYIFFHSLQPLKVVK